MDVTAARLKVGRAKEHLADLQGQVGAWLAVAGMPQFTGEVSDQGRTYVVRLAGVPDTPAQWPLVLGDVLHNLRSALDLLAWQAVLAAGGTPGRKTTFPVSRNPDPQGGKDVSTALAGAAPALVAEVRRMQPYVRCPTQNARSADPLWMLHTLNIADKHRLLVVCAQVVPDISYTIPEQAVGCTVTVTLQPAGSGAEVLRLSNLAAPIGLDEIDPTGALDVWVAETDQTAYLPVARLGALVTVVEDVIGTFDRHG